MKNITVTTLTILFTLTVYLNNVLSTNSDDYSVDVKKKDGEKKYSLWFGPRIGRRKRNPTEDFLKNLDREEIETLLEEIRNSPLAMAAFTNGQRYKMGFTPRLGRDSGEEFDDADLADFIAQRSTLFIPRLGRRFSPFSPRLGREN